MEKKDFKPEKAVIGKILKIGVPIAAQDGLIQVAFIIITIIANRRGLNDAAAVGIVEKIISFIFLVPSSMLSTVSALGEFISVSAVIFAPAENQGCRSFTISLPLCL